MDMMFEEGEKEDTRKLKFETQPDSRGRKNFK